jgi:arylsulfatase A-like enzyme
LGDWLGCYDRPFLATPNLDRLAAQGVVFDRYFGAAPICMPSRAAALTGVMPHQVGVLGQDPLDGSRTCLPEWFRRAGYETVVSGGLMVMNQPDEIGFTQVLPASSDGERAAAAAAYLQRRGGAGSAAPFFLHVSFSHVHRPFGLDHDPDVAAQINPPPPLPDLPLVRQDMATLARNVAELDALVGQVLDALEAAGLAEKTITVFTTEHGVALGRHKHTLYDGGIKIALLLRAPGLTDAGVRCGQLLSNVDVMPTLLELAGIAPPSGILGRSFARLARSARRADGGGRDAVFSEQTWGRRSGAYYYMPARSLRTERWKLIQSFTPLPPYIDSGFLARFVGDFSAIERIFGHPTPAYQLFDLTTDPHELRNVADDPRYDEALAELRGRLTHFLELTDDPILRGPILDNAGMPDVPQWVEQPDGTYRISAAEPTGRGESRFADASPVSPAQTPHLSA